MTSATEDLLGDACALELRAWGWLLAVTLPVAAFLFMLSPWRFLTSGDQDPVIRSLGDLLVGIPQAFTWTLLVDVVAVPFSIGAAIVSLPFTGALALALRRVRSRAVHVVSTSVLAGGIAAGIAVPVLDPSPFAATIVVAAGAAAAIARHRSTPDARLGAGPAPGLPSDDRSRRRRAGCA